MDAVTYSRGLLQRRRIIRTMDQSRNDYVCSPHLPLSLSLFLTRCNIRHIFRSGGGGGDRNEVSVGG
jgi:hypothetical protein